MQGQLFSQDFLTRGVCDTVPWQALAAQPAESAFARFEAALRGIFASFDATTRINEAQTEALVIHNVLAALGWGDDTLPQVNMSSTGREDVPDLLLFASAPAKRAALAEQRDPTRYRHGVAVLEAKRWLRPLDRGDVQYATDPDAPSSQMLRYLSRAEVVSDRAVRWGVLTNGALWRLYWQNARSRSEEFFELDLAAALGLAGLQGDPAGDAPATPQGPAHALKLFYLLFGRSAFLPQDWDSAGRSLHAYALNEARLYEEKVAQDLGARVFGEIFPQLADALARGDPKPRSDPEAHTQSVGYGQFKRPQYTRAYLDEVREATLVLLYRLLFLFYAEDRNLLPVRDERYQPYSVRRIREEVRDKVEAGAAFSGTIGNIWLRLNGVFELIDKGDDGIGMPAYNGGLFDQDRAGLIWRARVPDAVMAPIIDALSRRTEDAQHGWINYRDLSVAHLGGIYERLLDYTLVHEVQARDNYKDLPEVDRITAQPASFARKVSGSYYTHDDLVRLILRESVGLLARERLAAFEDAVARFKKKASLNPADWGALDAADPASAILELKLCDPAMGSGHFLVALVDDLADRVLEAMNTATHRVGAQPWAAYLQESGRPWLSPLVARIAAIRASIKSTAHTHGWTVTDAQLDDRHIVRRMILKKSIFGVDKNPMAVELAKTALWLHTFTVGAPLSFLDHHLRVGDSLHGERLPQVQRDLQHLGALLLQNEFDRLGRAAKNIAQITDLTDADIAEAQLSKELASAATAEVAPLHAVLDFWRAMRWLVPGWPADNMGKLHKLFKTQAKTPSGEPDPLLDGLVALLHPSNNLVTVLGAGRLDCPACASAASKAAAQAANALMAQARALAARETFFHWHTSFPTVFGAGSKNGFDAVIGNPPWDRIKLQEVEWFAERSPAIASQSRAADRKKMIAALKGVRMKQTATHTPPSVDLWTQYQEATERAEAHARVLGNGKQGCGDYPLLGGGDINLYSLFVERAHALVAKDGLVALLTPSGIAADKGAAEFFSSISSTGRLGALFDFENRKGLFPDVDSRFKFCTLVFGGPERSFAQTRCAFYLHALAELDDPARTLVLTSADFARANPNTGAAPIFRSRRDADITLALYARHPVLVKHGGTSASLGRQDEVKAWPVKYQRMFDMTNDSGLFLKPEELQQQGWKPAALNRWEKEGEVAVPLYVGKNIWHYNHRASSVEVTEGNLKVSTSSALSSVAEMSNASFFPTPQYWLRSEGMPASQLDWAIGFRDITNATNARTMVAAVVPHRFAGNTLPLLTLDQLPHPHRARDAGLLLANMCSYALDYIARQKAQSTHLNWYTIEQLPVIAPPALHRAPARRLCQSHARRQADERPPPAAHGGGLCTAPGAGADLHRTRHGALCQRPGLCGRPGPCAAALCVER